MRLSLALYSLPLFYRSAHHHHAAGGPALLLHTRQLLARWSCRATPLSSRKIQRLVSPLKPTIFLSLSLSLFLYPLVNSRLYLWLPVRALLACVLVPGLCLRLRLLSLNL